MKHLPIISGENVSRNFKKYIRSALHRVPAPIISALAEDGWQIQLSPKAETLFAPSSRVAASFASASGTSHKRLRGATCMSGEHVVAFFESYIDDSGIIQQGPGSWITEDQIVHEIGHAIDRKTGEDTGTSLSDSPDFIAAYHRDLAGLNNRERIHFNYFIAKEKGNITQDQYARREVVAEGFSQLLLGGQKNEPTDNNGTLLLSWLAGTPQNSVRPFREAFSHSLAALENELSPRWLTPATQSQKTLLEPT